MNNEHRNTEDALETFGFFQGTLTFQLKNKTSMRPSWESPASRAAAGVWRSPPLEAASSSPSSPPANWKLAGSF